MRNFIRNLAITLAVASVPALASASCFGTANNYTCYDNSTGNQYNVQKYGNNTYMSGSNSRTGTTWNQNTTRYGNSSSTWGSNSRGQSWNSYSTPYGSSGTDSRGNTYFNYNR